MCSTGRGCVYMGACRAAAAVVCIVAAVTVPSRGQTLGELEMRVDSLAERWEIIDSITRRADSIRRNAVAYDTIRQGALTVLVAPQWSRLVAQAVADAAPRFVMAQGRDSAIVAARRWFVWVRSSTFQPTPAGDDIWSITVDQDWEPSEIANHLVSTAEIFLAALGHDATIRWLSTLPIEDRSARWDELTYMQMVTAPSKAVQQCYLGELQWCREALFPGASPDPITRWYSPSQRRAVVSRYEREDYPALRASFDACLEGMLDDRCEAFLRAIPEGQLAPPFTRQARLGLVWTALQMGKDGAYGRFLQPDSVSVEDRVVRTAGVSVDSVLVTWRARVLAASPQPILAPPATRWAALAWFVLFSIAAIGSTRWR